MNAVAGWLAVYGNEGGRFGSSAGNVIIYKRDTEEKDQEEKERTEVTEKRQTKERRHKRIQVTKYRKK